MFGTFQPPNHAPGSLRDLAPLTRPYCTAPVGRYCTSCRGPLDCLAQGGERRSEPLEGSRDSSQLSLQNAKARVAAENSHCCAHLAPSCILRPTEVTRLREQTAPKSRRCTARPSGSGTVGNHAAWFGLTKSWMVVLHICFLVVYIVPCSSLRRLSLSFPSL